MDLLADRFVVSGTEGIDLATLRRVRIVVGTCGGPAEQARWAAACEECVLNSIAPRLVDFGVIGIHQRFEAWDDRPQVEPSSNERVTIAGTALADAIDAAQDCRTRAVGVAATPADAAIVLERVAQHGRRAGFVPLSAHALLSDPRAPGQPVLREAIAGRSLLILADSAVVAPVALVTAVVRVARPHVLVYAGPSEIAAADMLRLPLPPAVRGRRGLLRAAEQTEAYGAGVSRVEPDAARSPKETAYVDKDLIHWRRRASHARQAIDLGRHASGERLLRQAIAALARRGDRRSAGEGLVALAAALLRRGAARDALRVSNEACDHLQHDRAEGPLVDAAIVAGEARLAMVRLDEAESSFAAAAVAAGAIGDSGRRARAAAAIADVLFWRGHYAESLRTLDAAHADAAGDRVVVGAGRVRALAALGRLTEAGPLAAQVMTDARVCGTPALIARAAHAAVLTHLMCGDLEAARRDGRVWLTAARSSGNRIQVAMCRLAMAECERRAPRSAAAHQAIRRLMRVSADVLPPLVRAHGQMLQDLLAEPSRSQMVAERHAAASGLGALKLLIPTPPDRQAPPSVDVIVDILEMCHAADSEAAILGRVCGRVGAELHAAAVAIYSYEPNGWSLLASEGTRVDSAAAERARISGIVIEPHQIDERIVAAAPVRFGGAIVGAIVVRWALGSSHSRAHAAGALALVAPAVAPVVALARVERTRPRDSHELIGTSAAARDIRSAIDRAALAPFAVLIEGESGSGKELVARALHQRGNRRGRPFCGVNCAALPDDLLEAELFGHARGAFTGAVAERVGVFEEAHTGTLFLDEIGELSPRAQAKVLRVIQEGELRRVGENVMRRVDVRIVAATNRDLRRDADQGRFRADLLYRLDVVRITVPPLRERREDIPLHVDHFWRDAAARVGSRAVLSPKTVAALARYDWPGNVRELQNVLAALAVRVPKRGSVGPEALPPLVGAAAPSAAYRLDDARRTFEDRFVRAALARAGGRRAQAAAELGLTRQGLAKLMTRLGIEERAKG